MTYDNFSQLALAPLVTIGSSGYDAKLSYVIKDVIPSNSLCSIYGASGAYKSFLAISWACHIASGINWGEKKVSQGIVLYIVGEGGIGVPRRIKAWELSYNKSINDLYLINSPIFLASKKEVKVILDLAEYIKNRHKLPIQMIVIDTLARCFGGADENDAKDMGAFIRGCDELKIKTGATVLIIHHSGKDESKGARGSSAFRAALDTEYKITREENGGAFIIKCTKMKDAEEVPPTAYDLETFELYHDEDDEVITSLCVKDKGRAPIEDQQFNNINNASKNHLILLKCIRSRTLDNNFCTKSIIREDLKKISIDTKNLSRWLNKLVSEKLIRIDGEYIFYDKYMNN